MIKRPNRVHILEIKSKKTKKHYSSTESNSKAFNTSTTTHYMFIDVRAGKYQLITYYNDKRKLYCDNVSHSNDLNIMIFNFVLYFASLTFYSSVTDESFVDETRVMHKYKIAILISIMSLFTTTGSMPLLVKFFIPPKGITSPAVSTFVFT